MFTPTFSALVGYQVGDDTAYRTRITGGGDDNYLYWNAGVTFGFLEKWSLDLRYWDFEPERPSWGRWLLLWRRPSSATSGSWPLSSSPMTLEATVCQIVLLSGARFVFCARVPVSARSWRTYGAKRRPVSSAVIVWWRGTAVWQSAGVV